VTNRRNFIAGSMATVGAALMGGVPRPAQAAAASELAMAAREAWLYSVPLVELAAVRQRLLAARPANAWKHNRDLTDVTTQKVTSPNNDTIYSNMFLDLRRGPVTITLPPSGSRYLSVQLVDMFSNNIAVLGTRTTGANGGRFVVAGPNAKAPAGAIRAPSDWVFVLARTLIDGVDDLPGGRAVQDGLAVEGAAGEAVAYKVPKRSDDWNAFFAGVGELLLETPPPATDQAVLERIAAIGLGRNGFRPRAFSTADEAQIRRGVEEARRIAGQIALGIETRDGWSYPPFNIGRFEQDYEFRAQIAVSGLFALPLEEAYYTRSSPDTPDSLFHGDDYHLRFAGDALPPVDAFWSLTLYEAAADGQFWFTANPLNRYAIGDRTAGLKRGPDGSIDVWISRRDPGAERRSNWLPAPASGPFMLSMRAYLPGRPLLTGEYRYPAVRALG
jgi:hypothetical protein